MAVRLSIAHQQFYGRCLLDEIAHGSILLQQVNALVLCDAEIGVDLAVIGDGDQWLGNGAAHQGTYMIGNHASHTVHRTTHHGVGEVVAGIEFLGFCQ